MESLITAVGMVLAFALGAYIRQPFEVIARKAQNTAPEKTADAELKEFLKKESEAEQRRQMQILKALSWNGEKEGVLKDE